MNFTKMHGLGNDFIVVEGETILPGHAAELAEQLCNRFFGIGADGLVYILPSEKADFRMRIMNSDGSEAEQCGNAIRCVAKYVYDNGLTNKENITIETFGAGVQKVQLSIAAGKVETVRVDMGSLFLMAYRFQLLLMQTRSSIIQSKWMDMSFISLRYRWVIRTVLFMLTMQLILTSAYGGQSLRLIRCSRAKSMWNL